VPALFAYVIAVGLLLGGGYGALSWLAAPEPVKVAARVKAKPPQRYEAASDIPSAATTANPADRNGKAAAESDKAASASNAQPPAEVSVANQPEANQNAPAESSSPATSREMRSARAELAPVEQKPPADQPDPTATTLKQVPPATPKIAASAASAPAKITVKRPHMRQASRQPEKTAAKRRLALMILRTIQYPDGRRVSQLLPYRGGRRALAFVPDE
jgi:hypothetical protein